MRTNVHTEQEARALWCPHARVFEVPAHGEGAVQVNRPKIGEPPKCWASTCSQWRWGESMLNPSMRRGYCGLASNPNAI